MHLEAFNKEAHHLVRYYEIVGLPLDALKQLLGVDPAVEQYGADVPLDLLPKVITYVSEPFQFDNACFYQVDFYSQ